SRSTSRCLCYVRGLWAFLALNDFKLDAITFCERFEAAALNGAVVNEDVRPAFAGNEPKTFRVVEPLHCAGDASHGTFLSIAFPRLPPDREAPARAEGKFHALCRPAFPAESLVGQAAPAI